jgi:hypothetical protein
MNRVTMSALCVAACFILTAKHTRGVLGVVALEKVEHVFDLVERRLSRAM